MKRYLVIFLFLLSFSPWLPAQQLSSVPPTCKYNTVAHRLLQIEELAFKQTELDYGEMYGVLDSLIEKATEEIKTIQASSSLDQTHTSEREKAKQIFMAIDRALWEMDFILCIKTHYLHQALEKRRLPLDKSSLHFWSEAYAQPQESAMYFGASLNATAYPQTTLMSKEKKDKFLADPQTQYRLIDCDLAAYIYLAVGEVLDLPIYLVEVPGHFFVRYEFSDQTHLNWDNNSVREFSDDDYRNGLIPSAKKPFNPEEEVNNHYLVSLTREEAIALHTSFIVGGRMIQTNPDLALKVLGYVDEINPESQYADPLVAEGYNAYGYAKTLDGNNSEAIPYFSKALVRHPEHGRAYDNLGFAMIQNGSVEEGLICLEKAESCGNNLKAYSLRNYGVYYAALGKQRKAKKQYKKALKLSKDDPTDLLEFQFATLLLEKGKTKRAEKYLQIAADRGEKLALKRLKEL